MTKAMTTSTLSSSQHGSSQSLVSASKQAVWHFLYVHESVLCILLHIARWSCQRTCQKPWRTVTVGDTQDDCKSFFRVRISRQCSHVVSTLHRGFFKSSRFTLYHARKERASTLYTMNVRKVICCGYRIYVFLD